MALFSKCQEYGFLRQMNWVEFISHAWCVIFYVHTIYQQKMSDYIFPNLHLRDFHNSHKEY